MYVFICIYTIFYGIAVYMCFSLFYVMVSRIFLASILNTHSFPVNSLEYGQTQKMSGSGRCFSCSCGVDYLDVGRRCQYGVPPVVVMCPDRQISCVILQTGRSIIRNIRVTWISMLQESAVALAMFIYSIIYAQNDYVFCLVFQTICKDIVNVWILITNAVNSIFYKCFGQLLIWLIILIKDLMSF